MISIYKISKKCFKTIFAIEGNYKFFFYNDGHWEEDLNNIDIDLMKKVYGQSIDLDLLVDLDVSEKIEFDDVVITCRAKFLDISHLEENSSNVIDFLDSYAKLMDTNP